MLLQAQCAECASVQVARQDSGLKRLENGQFASCLHTISCQMSVAADFNKVLQKL
jgi:hypothetical protein